MSDIQFFHYVVGKSFIHRMSPAIKILLLLLLAIATFYFPLKICILGWVLALICQIFLHFRLSEILTDLKPTLIYLALIYFSSILTNLISTKPENLYTIFTLNPYYLLLFVRLGFSLSLTSILFRTTTTVQFTQGFSSIEYFFTRNSETPLANTISLTLTFIPTIITNYHQILNAWNARQGKNSIKKLLTLVPLLFSVSMNHAYNKNLAIKNRANIK